MTFVRVFILGSILTAFLVSAAHPQAPNVSSADSKWKINTVRICKTAGGSLEPTLTAIGSYPVYTFFIPRPVWTVNGSVVNAVPIHRQGRLVEFQLLDGASYLNPGQRNTVKFSLPDQSFSKVFLFDDKTPVSGDCYEFF
jgi:hypothetical protein